MSRSIVEIVEDLLDVLGDGTTIYDFDKTRYRKLREELSEAIATAKNEENRRALLKAQHEVFKACTKETRNK